MHYKDGESVTLQAIQDKLNETAQQYNIPIAFRSEQISSGLFGGGENCLVVYHPEHLRDYYSIAVRVKYQGSVAFVSIDSFGVSKLTNMEAIRKQFNAAAKEGINYHGYNPLEHAVAGASLVAAGIIGARHLVKGKSDKEKMEAEQQWYTIICDIFDEILQ